MTSPEKTDGARGFQPLSGYRVLDFTWSVLGPTLTRNLAALGAEVLKLEWPKNPDPMRKVMYATGEENPGLDNGPFFSNLNVGKRSFTIDAKSDQGKEIIRELIAQCDVVAESFSSQVFRKWGFSYEELARINPRIVYISASGFGHSGTYEHYETWGPTAQAITGVTAGSGDGGEPAGWGWSYLDTMGGALATVGVLAALVEARRSGTGQYIDLSQTDLGIGLTGPSTLDVLVNGRDLGNVAFPPGNRAVSESDGERIYGYRGELGAPYGCYRASGDDHNDYIAISVLSDAEWKKLAEAMGHPAWALDARFDTVDGRIAHQDELDERVEAWTRGFDKFELLETLQSHGVRCGPVQSNIDLLSRDPQVAHRELYPKLEHPLLGNRRFEALPIGTAGERVPLRPQWPLLGEGNGYVLKEILGKSDADVAELEEAGVTWPIGLDRHIAVARPTW